jgi:PAS domain S-box-containing protein
LIDDLLRLATSTRADVYSLMTFRYVFWLVPHVLAVVSTRLRHLPLTPQAAVHRTAPYENARLPAASSRTLVFALSFPTVHLLFHQLELLDAAHKPVRTALAFGWMLLLGLVALAQTRLLDRRATEIWGERKRFEAQLSSSEDDLRVILERRRAERSLKVAEDRFERIFRICPDAVAITTEEDGRIVDANPGFERATGFEREELLGRTFAEIGIGTYPGGREALLRQLDKRGVAIELEVNFRQSSGQVRIARLLLDRVTIGGQRCLITLARDITERKRIEVEREKQATLLDNASAAIYALDGEERISFWNRGAERLFGQNAGEALGHPAGDLETLPRSGARPAIELWSTAILDDQGRPAGRLVIACEAKIS